MRKAVLDVGSNSVLLTVEERTETGWVPVQERTAVTSLGKGTKETGLLSEEAMANSLTAIQGFFKEARDLGCESTRALATMAVRIATNQADFLERAAAQGTPVTVLSGEDEAEYGFRAVATDPIFRAHNTISIIDPGGQSTEMVTAHRDGDGWKVAFRRSYPVGTLGLRGQYGESLDIRAILASVAQIDDLIGLAYRPGQAGIAVTLGATGTNLVSIREKLETWQPEIVHGAWLDYEEVSKAAGWMLPMTDLERKAIPGIERGRESTLHYGALTLERFMFSLRVLGCYVSIRGWRHAILEE
jgi:exopolyphosphatase/guanosine-5'-triphosphate,3'-diphosphate pyrophosphatase